MIDLVSVLHDVVISVVGNCCWYYCFEAHECVLPDDGEVIAKTCRRDRNCTVIYSVCAYVDFVNTT